MSFRSVFLLILTVNTLHSQHNYLCDFNSNFTTNTLGTWNFDSNLCTLSQTKAASSTFGAVAWLGDNTETLLWNDYVIEAVVDVYNTYLAASYVGIIFRAQAITNQNQKGQYYAATLGHFDNVLGAYFDVGNLRYKITGGYDTLDESNTFPISTNQDYTMRIEVVGNSFAVYIDNTHIFTSTDNSLTSGSIGFRVTYAEAIFKSLYITLPTAMPTTAAPTTSTPTNLPTTALPTTVNPTTSLPTTTIPTTSIPTTFMSTTNAPTTAIPTTAMPTTFSPTTSEPTTRPTSTSMPSISPTIHLIESTNMQTESPHTIDDAFSLDDTVLIALIIAGVVIILCVAFIGYCCYKEKSRNDIKRKEIQLEMEKINQLSISQQSPVGSVSGPTCFINETDTTLKMKDPSDNEYSVDDNEEMYEIDENKRTLNEGVVNINTNIAIMDESDENSNDEMYKHTVTAGNKKGFYARVISDYDADDEDQLSMKQGVIVFVLQEYITESGWYYGIDQNGSDGWIPSNYLNKCDDMEQIELEKEEQLQIELMDKCYKNINDNNAKNQINMDKYLKMPPRVPPVTTNGELNNVDEMSSDEEISVNKETTAGGQLTND